ncbi:hypothetical protein pb186bvf_007188, partial [Paramecium bursaria]
MSSFHKIQFKTHQYEQKKQIKTKDLISSRITNSDIKEHFMSY